MRGNHVPSPARPAARLSEAGHRPYCAAHDARRHEALPDEHTPSPARGHFAPAVQAP
jgi:hypothetical protein